LKSHRNYILLLLIILLNFSACSTSQVTVDSDISLFEWLSSQTDLTVKKIEGDSAFTEIYEIFIEQPVDHFNPHRPKFTQKFYLSHINRNKPMVVELDGYSVRNRPNELSRILKSNQMLVEHRYFGESVPEPFDWQYLDIRQAAEDHHRIISKFKEFYSGKWVSTGISKGGSTVIFHRRFYPDDVDASVSYVGPIARSIEDQRVYEFLKNVSTPECRQRVYNFQVNILKNRDKYFPMFLENAEENNLSYNIVGQEKAFEYSVLEYSFAFWQWDTGGCEKIPDANAGDEEIFEHFKKNSGVDYFTDNDITSFYPFFYQAYKDYGYYAYDTEPFKDYIKYADGQTPFFIPEGVNLVFNPEPMKDMSEWVENEGENFIFIYGGNDPWTAAGVCLTGKTNSIKMVHPNGSHRTRIKTFSAEDQEIIYSKLEEWLDIIIER
jgi:hypothetical protein